MTMTNKNFLIKLDAPYRIKYEEISDFDKSLFNPVYHQAVQITREIILKNKEYHKITVHKGNDYRNNEQIYNVISFVGDRGAGKTSCMLSYAEYLKDYSKKKNNLGEDYLLYDNVEFIGISAIDAGLLERDEDLIDVVLAKLYDRIQKMGSNGNIHGNNDYDYNRREFNRSTQKLYESNLRRKEKDTASVNGLREMAISVEMRENIKDMINKFIRVAQDSYIQRNVDPKDCFVVIPVDDIDMNISNGYEMLEQIRRYLMVPNVILLLSYKHKQLKGICELYYTSKMKDLEKIYNDDSYKQKVLHLAKSYMEKALPDSRRIDLHTIGEMEMMYQTDVLIIPTDSAFTVENGRTLEQTFLRKVYRCFNMRSHTPDGRGMEIWKCDNIRNLCNLFNELHAMSDPKSDGKNSKDKNRDYEENYRWLLEYITRKAEQHLEEQQIRYLLQCTTDNILLFMCEELNNALNKHKEKLELETRSRMELPKKCDIGDVIYYMNHLSKISEYKNLAMLFREYLIAFVANIYYSKALYLEQLEKKGNNKQELEDEIKREMAKVISIENGLGCYNNKFLPEIEYSISSEQSTPIKGPVGSLIGINGITLQIAINNKEISKQIFRAVEIVFMFLSDVENVTCTYKIGQYNKNIEIKIEKWNFKISNILWNVFKYGTREDDLAKLILRDIGEDDITKELSKKSIKKELDKWCKNRKDFDLNKTLICNFDLLTYLCEKCASLTGNESIDANKQEFNSIMNIRMRKIIGTVQSILDKQDIFYQEAYRHDDDKNTFIRIGEKFEKCPVVKIIKEEIIPYGFDELFAKSDYFREKYEKI